ncbi:uncharacterized protein A1O5_01079 [Cladophialophora psammophila CBS 110553]|uniref:Heterokaryon incompatibility domain-containing protein n=1 Tax=Cladophialophora psammophila CBS 110553 TaxID=1182543 RepID=W9XHZ3_9EURO|nr:uncharacterized protein A1O5_01079 [Cladophialophora psammophila CBS 110553]EXJ76571.1 hypothetical protein A1O5_01079 [Cladophialophora psammophila CBS 110553]
MFDGQTFSNFLRELQGQNSSPSAYWDNLNTTDIPAHAQKYLYFGLLIDVLQNGFNLSSFVPANPSASQQVVSLHMLLVYPLNLVIYHKFHLRLVELATEVLRHAAYLRTLSPQADLICLSIEVLVWTLQLGSKSDVYIEYNRNLFRAGGVLQKRMLDAGWCMYSVQQFCGLYSPALLYYMSGLTRSKLDRCHKKCTPLKCYAHTIDPAFYKTKHVTENCTCRLLKVDINELLSVIKDRGIPIIQLSGIDDQSTELVLTRANFLKEYVAISHVWSGGLGNPKSNSLPICQLKRLREATKQRPRQLQSQDILERMERTAKLPSSYFTSTTHKDCYIWIDTLCIPVVPPEEEVKRQDAIQNMAYVYAAAKRILVIDESLADLRSDDVSDEEFAVRILISPWMSRCWTFQEGALAQSLGFALRDRTVPAREWMLSLDPALSAPSKARNDQMLVAEALAHLDTVPSIMDSPPGSEITQVEEYFSSIWSQLSMRTTSRPADAYLIMSIMLRLDVKEIRDQPVEKRMKALLRSQETLPMSLLFLPLPKGADGLAPDTWVPRYPVGQITHEYGTMKWIAERTALKLNYQEGLCTILTPTSTIPEGHEVLTFLDAPFGNGGGRPHFHLTVWPQIHQGSSFPMLRQTNRLCIILHPSTWVGYPPPQNRVGAIFSILNPHAHGGELYLSYSCPLRYGVQQCDQKEDGRSECEMCQNRINIPVERLKNELILECSEFPSLLETGT